MSERTYQIACVLGWHRWEKWGPRYEVKMVTIPVNQWTGEPLGDLKMEHVHVQQDRACRECGKQETRRVTT